MRLVPEKPRIGKHGCYSRVSKTSFITRVFLYKYSEGINIQFNKILILACYNQGIHHCLGYHSQMVNSIREYRYLYAFPREKKSTKHFVNLVNMQVIMRHSVSHCTRRNTGCITNYMSAIILSSSLRPPPPTLPSSLSLPTPTLRYPLPTFLLSTNLICYIGVQHEK